MIYTRDFKLILHQVQECFCHLNVYLLLNYFIVVSMSLGRYLFGRNVAKCTKIQLKVQKCMLSIIFPKAVQLWGLCQADSGPQALCCSTPSKTKIKFPHIGLSFAYDEHGFILITINATKYLLYGCKKHYQKTKEVYCY